MTSWPGSHEGWGWIHAFNKGHVCFVGLWEWETMSCRQTWKVCQSCMRSVCPCLWAWDNLQMHETWEVRYFWYVNVQVQFWLLSSSIITQVVLATWKWLQSHALPQGRREDCGGPGQIQKVGPILYEGGLGARPQKILKFYMLWGLLRFLFAHAYTCCTYLPASCRLCLAVLDRKVRRYRALASGCADVM